MDKNSRAGPWARWRQRTRAAAGQDGPRASVARAVSLAARSVAARARSAAACRRRSPPGAARPTLAPGAPPVSTDTPSSLRCVFVRNHFRIDAPWQRPLQVSLLPLRRHYGRTTTTRSSPFLHRSPVTCLVIRYITRPRFLVLVARSVATLAHRAMQRGPCKSRVTVTSAHGVLVPLQWRLNIYLYIDWPSRALSIAFTFSVCRTEARALPGNVLLENGFSRVLDALIIMLVRRNMLIDAYLARTNSWLTVKRRSSFNR